MVIHCGTHYIAFGFQFAFTVLGGFNNSVFKCTTLPRKGKNFNNLRQTIKQFRLNYHYKVLRNL